MLAWQKYRDDAVVRADEERQNASEELQQLDALASASGSEHPCASCYNPSSATCQEQKCEDWSIPAGHRLVNCDSTREGMGETNENSMFTSEGGRRRTTLLGMGTLSEMDCDGLESELNQAAKAHFEDQVEQLIASHNL